MKFLFWSRRKSTVPRHVQSFSQYAGVIWSIYPLPGGEVHVYGVYTKNAHQLCPENHPENVRKQNVVIYLERPIF